MRKSTVTANPRLPELLIKAHAEAIKRFYDDKAFAVKAYQVYDKQPTADVERFYEGYRQANLLERVPYVLAGALNAVIDQQTEPATGRGAEGWSTIARSSTTASVDRLVKEGFFEKLFGPGDQGRRRSQGEAGVQVDMPVQYRADHVGSFLRPRAILDARSDPRVTPDALREIEDADILQLLERQQELGFDILTDGELRRDGFMSDFYDSSMASTTTVPIARAWKGQPQHRRHDGQSGQARGSRRRQDHTEEAAHQSREPTS